ncbi:MAG: GGDEF domain-containing protein [Rhodococcus sp. (in: high G+C Gram-positive bacteria)]
MNKLHEWWSQPTDYAWTVGYTQSHPLLRHTRSAIGIYCWIYGLVCVLALTTPLVGDNDIGQAVIAAFGLSSVVVGVAWFRGPWPNYTWSLAFVVYAELGVTGTLFALDEPSVALLAASLMGVIGNYVAAFHNAKVFFAHQVWALSTCAVLYVFALAEHDTPVTQVTAYLVVLVLVLVSSPLLTQALLVLLERDAAVAHFDPLTGLRNRRGLDAAVRGLTDDAPGVSVLVADLDNFKSVNDSHGHSYGDDVLRKTSETLTRAFPLPAVTARTGGEEFVAVVSGPLSLVRDAAEQLRRAVPGCNPIGVTTTSIGIHHRPMPIGDVGEVLDKLLDCADAAMYEAKRLGGDSVVVDGSDDEARTGV